MSEAITSPCVNICVLDRESGLCIGCLRTGAEIGTWLDLNPAQRAAVMAELPARAGRLGPAAVARAKAAARRRA